MTKPGVPLRLILLALVCCRVVLPQVADVPATNGIFGHIVNSQTHEAVRRAAVKIFDAHTNRVVFSDKEGNFEFSSLATGKYALAVHRDGFTNRRYVVEQSDFDTPKQLAIQLDPQGVIVGKVTDRFGEAFESATIEALGPRTRGGNIEVLESTDSNDLGAYRLSGLNAGSYQIRATYRDGRRSEFDPTPLTMATAYLGGAETPTVVEVKAGSLMHAIDFVLSPAQPATVRGTLHTQSGLLTEPVTLWIEGLAGEGGHNDRGQDGAFQIRDMGNGAYTLSAQTLSKTAPLFGTVKIQVDGADVDAVDIVLKPAPEIAVEMRMDGKAPTGLGPGSIYFMPIGRASLIHRTTGQPDRDGNCSVPLIPGEYLLSFDEKFGSLSVQSVFLNGIAVTNWRLRIDEKPEIQKLVITLDKPTP